MCFIECIVFVVFCIFSISKIRSVIRLFDFIYYQDLKYKGIRTKGQIKVEHSADGDTTSCNIVYKTKERLVPKSLLNGREIVECVPVAGFGLDCGYINYVK